LSIPTTSLPRELATLVAKSTIKRENGKDFEWDKNSPKLFDYLVPESEEEMS